MATIEYSNAPKKLQLGFENVAVISWTLLTTTNNVGREINMPSRSDKEVQISGTPGSGGSVKIEGSNNGTDWYTLSDPDSNLLVFTAAGGKTILNNPVYVRPNVTAGDGTTSFTVTLCMKGNV